MDRLWTPWRYAYVTGTEKPEADKPGTNATTADSVLDIAPARPALKKGVPDALNAWPGEKNCVFCNMLAAVEYAVEHGMLPSEADHAAHIVWRGRHCFMVLNAFPYNSGHLMAVPYEHQASLAELPETAAGELMSAMRRAETALREVYKPHGINLGLNLGEAAGAGVAHHLHVHAVPRWSGDTSFMSVLAETRVLPEMLEESGRRLREALQQHP
jgi:ATP adenylyltransferase